MPKSPRRRISAFTLVELMVVVLIIGILVSILIPVVGSIKRKAQAASSLAQLNALRGAIEAYQQTYGAYPGPLADNIMFQVQPGQPPLPNNILPTGPGSRVTQSENLVLGLMGGLRYINGAIEAAYDPATQQWDFSGPRSLNPTSPGQHGPFYNNTRELSRGFFSDRVDGAGQPVNSCSDSSIPEFVDKFADPLPILYLRARKGAPGIISDMKFFNAGMSPDSPMFQYDVRQYYNYIADMTNDPPTQPVNYVGPSGPGSGPGLGGRQQGAPNRGLWQVGSDDGAARGLTDQWDSRLQSDHANYAATYFKHNTLNPPGTTNFTGTPRSKDQFILISAGADRIFGTADDLTTFGTPGE